MERPKIPEPTRCILWRDREQLENSHGFLESIETYEDDSHDRRCLLKCRECGQLYFYKFLEFVDYQDGEDPQYRTYIPVASANDAAMLSRMLELDIAQYTPAIHSDWPKGQDRPNIYWAGKSD